MAKRFILNETSYHGHGAVNEIVPEVKSRGFKKALIVTDADLVKFQVVKKVTDILDTNKMAYEIFDKVKANPSVEVVQAGVEAFRKAGADYMIAIGGGSPQDTAKGIGIIINNPEFADVVSLEGVAPTKNKSVPGHCGCDDCRNRGRNHHQLRYYRREETPQIRLRRSA